MAKYILLIPFIFLQFIFAQTQNVDLIWGEECYKRNWLNGIFSSDDNNLYGLNFTKKGGQTNISILTISKTSLKKISEFTFTSPIHNNTVLEFEDAFYLKNKFVLFYTSYKKSENKYYLYAQAFSMSGVAENIKEVKTEVVPNKRNRGKYKFGITDHQEVFGYFNKPLIAEDKTSLDYFIIDENGNTLKDTSVTIPVSNLRINILKAIYAKNGNLYFLTNNAANSSSGNDEKLSNKKYKVFGFFKDSVTRQYDLDLRSNWVAAASMKVDSSGNPSILGYYSNSQKYSFSGTFYMKINNQTRDVLVKKMTPFKKSKKSNSIEDNLTDYYFENLYLKPNGGYYLVAQKNFMEISSYMDPNTRTVAYDYYYNFLDIIVTNIDTSGNVLWTKKIPKNQITVNDNGLYSSYVSGIVSDQLVFVFSDHPKNIHTSQALKPMNNPKSSEVSIVSIDNIGNINKQSLFSSKLTKKVLKPYIYHTEDQELLIFITEDGRTECLSRIDFLTKQ